MTPVDRHLLPHTFGPWFGRFTELTEVQRRAIPLVMERRDVLICSATASGKTEAYAAPAAEIALNNGSPSAGVVIVSPTRALANDLKRRLESPMDQIGLSFGRYTGEHKEKTKNQLPAVIVTTPEALDSLLARRPKTLAHTRIVIIDEIHVLDGTPRGDQLRVLLYRLDRSLKVRPQLLAASATVDRPEELAGRYLRDFEVVAVPGSRKIRGRAFYGRGVVEMGQHLDSLAQHGLRKILAFCRSRNDVEKFATKLKGKTRFEDNIFAHHGSIAQDRRERTERLFHQAPSGVCFATLTLEMGIDIGTVDYVLLVGVPADVPSLLQRIGRGGRRGDTTRSGYVVKTLAEKHIIETMFRIGKEGKLCAAPYAFRPAVLVQQALVIAGSKKWVRAEDVLAIVPPALRDGIGLAECTELLELMVKRDLVERTGGKRFVLTESLENRYDRGVLHSNISSAVTMSIIDRLTGDVIGNVGDAPSRRIGIGGSDRTIVKTDGARILTDSSRISKPATFRPTGSPTTSLALGRAIVESLGVRPNTLAIFSAGGSWWLLHGLGTVGATFLAQVLGLHHDMREIEQLSPFVAKLTKSIEKLPPIPEETTAKFVEQHLGRLETIVAPGPWRESVPKALRLTMTRTGAGIDEVAAYLSLAQIVPAPDFDDATLSVAIAL